MADVFSKEKRSFVMSRIRSRGNKNTELALIRLLRINKITGWRRHPNLPGKPDIIFRKHKLSIFADGCFWHGCPKCYKPPKSNANYWRMKIERNRKRDKEINRELKNKGWKIIRLWECALKRRPNHCVARIKRIITVYGRGAH
ncbi:MAG: very short patch repair endonuclease [Candidatus Aminicenantales bacterium]